MRRRMVAALVVLVVAAGLAACGDGGKNGPTDAGGRPILPVGGGFGGQAAGDAAMVAREAPTPGDASAAMLAPLRPVEYRLASGAKAPATEAPAYKVVPAGDVDEASVRKALGVGSDGTVELHSGIGWSFQRDGDESVSSSSSGVAVACAPDQTCEQPTPTPPPAPPVPPGVPSAAEAKVKLVAILRALGVDPDKGRIEVLTEDGDLYQRQASFTPEVGGLRVSGLETYVSFGEHGRVDYGGGLVARFEKVGDYPLVDLAEALRRAQEGFGGIGDVRSMTAGAGATSSGTAEPVEPPQQVDPAPPAQVAPGEPSPGAPAPGNEPTMTIEPQPTTPTVPLEPEIVEVTGADLVLEPIGTGCEGDDLFVVPTFRLLPQERVGFTVPAVDAASLDVAGAAGDEEPAPCPEDTVVDAPSAKPEPATTVDAP